MLALSFKRFIRSGLIVFLEQTLELCHIFHLLAVHTDRLG